MILNKNLIRDDGRNGIVSVCSSNPYVIKAAIIEMQERNIPILLEATANQVNQFGGYTGMNPSQFRDYVYSLSQSVGVEFNNIILGGDHLGPLIWSDLYESESMKLAKEMVQQYVIAGFQKIHIDTSMKLLNDSSEDKLDDLIIAQRAAELIAACEEVRNNELVYIIGSEVPIPGGATSESGKIELTSVVSLKRQLRLYRNELKKLKIEHVYSDIIGVVVQPGVEFGDDEVNDYDTNAAKELRDFLFKDNQISYEGHSTDYQTKENLRKMVEDGIRILKVGPALTYAFRQAIYSLERIEREFYFSEYSNIRAAYEDSMINNPKKWKDYYRGTEFEMRLKRHFSYCDRIRYYSNYPNVIKAMDRLLDNLSQVILPLSLISEFFPNQYQRVRNNIISLDPESLIIDKIRDWIKDYVYAIT